MEELRSHSAGLCRLLRSRLSAHAADACMLACMRRNIFPIWALGLYRRAVLLGEDISH